jgi:hypothetical protein
MENSPPGRRPSATVSPCQRSRVTNGKTLFVEADNRGPWARRFRDVIAEITSDLGGADALSEAQRQLVRRAATISIACERMEGEAALGVDINLELYGRLTDRLGRALQRLGLERRARDVTPTLEQVIAEEEAARLAAEAAKAAETEGEDE